MNIVLDCSNIANTLNSLSTIFECTEERLISIVKSFDIESDLDDDYSWDQKLFNKICNETGNYKSPSTITLHHGTRETTGTDLNVLLPLRLAGPIIWKNLTELISHNILPNWIRFQDDLTSGRIKFRDGINDYAERTTHLVHQGPYGYLIKEFICSAYNTDHNYLYCSEFIEDIITSFNKALAETTDIKSDLLNKYRNTSQPIIATFQLPVKDIVNSALGHICCALKYICYTVGKNVEIPACADRLNNSTTESIPILYKDYKVSDK